MTGYELSLGLADAHPPTCMAKSVVTQPTRTSFGTAHCSDSRWICLMLLGVIQPPPSSSLSSSFLSSNPSSSSSSSSLGTSSPLSIWNNGIHKVPAHRNSRKKLACRHQGIIQQGLTSSSCSSRSILGKGFLQNMKELNSRFSGSPAGCPRCTVSRGCLGWS